MKFMLNQRGQAFDVFKLLIAAVVAIVILTILLNIINLIGPIGKGDPTKEAGNLVTGMVTNKASIQVSQPVVFSGNIKTLNTRGIAEASKYAVSTNQICVHPGDFKADTEEFEGDSEHKFVTYTRSGEKRVLIRGICDSGDQLVDTLETYLNETEMADWAGGCPCTESPETCCLLVLKKV